MTAGPAPDIEMVLQANRKFYQALAALDLRAMNHLWLNENWVRCIHPGWAPLEGWEAVHESWQRIFENTEQLHVSVGNVTARIEGDMAWVSCVERVSTAHEGQMDMAYVQATNLFVRRGENWRMVLHHASHLPMEPVAEGDETVH